MVTKKKAKVVNEPTYLEGYVPTSYSPIISSNSIQQIPPYDDAGVSYKLYSKRLKSDGLYELFPQTRQTHTLVMPAAGTVYTEPRNDNKKVFYVTHLHIDYYNNSGAFRELALRDGATASDRNVYQFRVNFDQSHFDIDLSDSPLSFYAPDIAISVNAPIGAGNYILVTLSGWTE